MGYYVTIQANPHDHDAPCYSEGDGSNVVELQIDDEGDHADALHDFVGGVIAARDSRSLDADAADEYADTVADLRDRLSKYQGETKAADDPIAQSQAEQ